MFFCLKKSRTFEVWFSSISDMVWHNGTWGVELSYLQVWVVDEEGVVWPVDAVEDHKDEREQIHRHLVHVLLQLLGLLIIHVFSNLSVDPCWLRLDKITQITQLTHRYNFDIITLHNGPPDADARLRNHTPRAFSGAVHKICLFKWCFQWKCRGQDLQRPWSICPWWDFLALSVLVWAIEAKRIEKKL